MNESIMNKLAWYTLILIGLFMVAAAFSKETTIGIRIAIVALFTPVLIFSATFLFDKNIFIK